MSTSQSKKPSRVVILGGTGFLGRHLLAELQAHRVPMLSLGSRNIDLAMPASVEMLKATLLPTDALVFASCLTPDRGKDIRTAMKNLAMGEHVCAALQAVPCAHVTYLSSDAVYADAETLVREDSRCEPSTLYGLGHLTRERMIQLTADAGKVPWLVLRPTLLYGVATRMAAMAPTASCGRFAKTASSRSSAKARSSAITCTSLTWRVCWSSASCSATRASSTSLRARHIRAGKWPSTAGVTARRPPASSACRAAAPSRTATSISPASGELFRCSASHPSRMVSPVASSIAAPRERGIVLAKPYLDLSFRAK